MAVEPVAPPGRPQARISSPLTRRQQEDVRDAMTSSAVRLSQQSREILRREARRMGLPWQQRAFAYYELLGEIWYAAQFYARALQKIQLRLVKRVGSDDWEDVEDPALLEYLDRVQDPGGGRANLMGSYGRLKFLTGECYLLVTREVDPEAEGEEGAPGDEVWEMLSCDELRWDPNLRKYRRYRLPNTQPEEYDEADDDLWEPLPDEAIAYRFWTRHPRYSGLADGPMRGVLDLCEELVILTRAVRARGRSRLAGSGILLIPSEVDFTPAPGTVPTEDTNAGVFTQMLTDAMVAGIVDEGTAAAVVPLVIDVGGDFIEKFRHLQIIDPMQTYPETGLRMECIQRIAIGLDMPPEILLGKADANHWSAWQIDEDSFTAHLQPVVQGLCDDFTGGYLRPSMRADGIANYRDYAIAYDATDVIVHPDRTSDAKDLHDRLVISDEALRDSAGFDDDDAPDDNEYARRVGVKLNVPELAVEGELPEPPEPAEPAVPPGQEQPPPPPPPGGGPADVQTGPPGDEQGEEGEAEVASLHPRGLEIASGLVFERALEKAGATIRSRFGSRKADLAILNGVPNREVGQKIALLGDPSYLETWGPQAHALTAGAGDCFLPRLVAFGLSEQDAKMLVRMAEQAAAEALFDPVRV